MATIRKRKDRYQAQVRVSGSPPLSRTFDTKRDAVAWARKCETDAETIGIAKDVRSLKKVSLMELLDRYEQEVTPKKRGHWREVYAILALKRHPISLKKLDALSEGDAASYRDARLKIVKASTVYRELALFRHVIETARRQWNLPIVVNPFALVRKPKLNNARTRRLEDGEWSKLRLACQASRNKCIVDMVDLAIETAMRRGEVLNIRKSHIDFINNTLMIPQAKNGHPRTIPLTASARELLNRRTIGLDDENVVFETTDIAIRMVWRGVIRRSGLNDLHYHDLRREAISRFLELGLTIPEVALISGHKCYKMLARYVKLRPENVALKLARLSVQPS